MSEGSEAPADEEEEVFHFAQTDPTERFGRFDQVLGRGAFKVVYKAFDTQEGTEVAWNQVRVSELMSTKDAENKEERDRLFAEIRVLKALKHKNIMSFYDSWYDAKTYTVNFITELFTSGTLRQYRKRHKHIDEEVLKRWAWQILCGLVYLHGHNPPIIHRDLKCDNIFINGSDGVVKIGDLGLATMLRSRTAPQSVLGTPEFMAPELYEEEYDDRVDVYSFGMCLLELSTMEYPYSECKNAAQIYRKVSLGVRPAGLQKVASQELAEFINVCISPRDVRPRARQLLKHPYFDSIRKDKLLVPSRSDAALAAASGGDGSSEYGSTASGPVSRTSSSLHEMVAAVSSAGHFVGGPTLQGPPSASSVGAPPGPLSRTTSTDVHSERAPSDSASVRSQRSNASELALAVLENIAEEGELAEHGEDAVEAGGMGSPGIGIDSNRASKTPSPHSSPPLASSPMKPSSPTGSEGCRCDATERQFTVKGNWLDGDKRINLRLRICESTGASRTVEFEFDVAVDTAVSVASEMVEDLQLTPEDTVVIASTIRNELARLSALPEIDVHASMSLEKAAQVLEHQLTVGALEQAHSNSGRESGLIGAVGARQHGRFAEQDNEAVSIPQAEPQPASLAAHVAAPDLLPQPGRPSFEANPTLKPSGGSTCSLASSSSAASFPYGSSLATGPQPSVEPVPTVDHAPTLAQRCAPHGSSMTAQPLLPGTGNTFSAAGNASFVRPLTRPVSPLSAQGVAHVAPADMPSPSQRVLRTNSLDAMSLLSRSSSMPPGREPVASPLGIGSGTLSPTSGILSPSTSMHEKRIPLNQLFENLQDLAAGRTSSPGLEATLVAASGPALPPNLPPLPHPSGCRSLPPSNSGSALAGSSSGDLTASSLLRPRSEACLASLPWLNSSGMPVCASASAPTSGALAAATALADTQTFAAFDSMQSPRLAPGAADLVADTTQRLDLTPSAPGASLLPQQTGKPTLQALSAPPSKLPSRDVSPAREGSMSPRRAPSILAAQPVSDAAAQLNGRRPALKDKEALRRQAADAMKAVELRSLNLLEGGLGAGKATRGVPMAATKAAAVPLGNGIPANGAQLQANGIPAVPAVVLASGAALQPPQPVTAATATQPIPQPQGRVAPLLPVAVQPPPAGSN